MATEFLAELYLPRLRAGELDDAAARARAAAAAMRRDGTPVRYVRSLFVPEDETCFFLFEAPSAEAVAEASRRAGIAVERVVEAVQVGQDEPSPGPVPTVTDGRSR